MLRKYHNGMAFSLQKREKAKDFVGVWRRLLRACRHHVLGIAVALAAAVGAAVLAVLAPLRLAELTDLFTAGIDEGVNVADFADKALVLLLFYLLGALCSVLSKWLLSGMTQHVSHALRRKISQKINRLPTLSCENAVTGDLLSRVTNDMDTVGHAMHECMAELPSAVALLLGSLVAMLLVSVPLAVLSVVITLLGALSVFLIMRHSQRYFTRQQKDLGDLEAYVEEAYEGCDTVKLCNAQPAVKKGFLMLNKRLEHSVFRARFMAGTLSPLMSFVANLAYLSVCVVGSLLVLSGQLSFGAVVAFVFFVHLFIHPFTEIANAMQGLQSAAAAGERVYDFLDAEEIPLPAQGCVTLSKVRGEVEFSHVDFTYPGHDAKALQDVSFTVSPGQTVAIVGASGSGKSTLARLLGGFYLPTDGEVRIDGVATDRLSQKQIHRLIAPVFRNAWVFEGSLRDNLVYCNAGVSDEELYAACRAVGIHRYIRTLPKGYDTVIGRDLRLSEGQLQQLEIARALLSDHPLLIFDEATAALDPRAEGQILSALHSLARGKTTFLIAHRPATVKKADLVLFLQDGRLAASGTHEQLLATDAAYSALLCDRV